MRVIAGILMIYIFGLTVMPCHDSSPCESSKTEESFAQLSEDIHFHFTSSEDFCSPFCECQCCGSSIDLYDFDISIPHQPQISYNDSYISRFTKLSKFQLIRPPQA